MLVTCFVAFLAVMLVALSVSAEVATPSIPDALKPWIGWVRDGSTSCPPLYDRANSSHCAWPSHLALSLNDRGGTFTQTWHIDSKTHVPLPGDAKRWPLTVTVDGHPGRVVSQAGAPLLELGEGEHTVRGAFAWDSLPESLAVPKETGLLTLSLHGSAVASPNRDAEGTVWFQKAKTDEEGDSLGVVVHRKVIDDIPLRLVTRVELHVSGKSREELLGKALPADFIPLSLETPLPARVEPDGRVRVQVRPGVFTFELTARARGPVTTLSRPTADGPWKEGDEVWVFEAKNDYRVVSVEGVASIDPQQTALPDAWKRLPAYAMSGEATMRFVESRRGDANPAPDQLTLHRSLWLDFDGRGYTVRDNITGALNRASRLTMASPETTLGRVAISDQDQFITSLAKGRNAETGVEIRQGEISVTADSRVAGQADIPAVGWAHDFREVSGTLNLPPGWTLLYATGVDDVPDAWVRRWSLALVFLALMITIAFGRLHGPLWGVIACAMLVLALPENEAPGWVFIPLVAIEALLRVLPEGRARKGMEFARVAGFAVVALIAIAFAVDDVKQGIHPMLARPDTDIAPIKYSPSEGQGGGARAKSEVAEPREERAAAVAQAPAPMSAPSSMGQAINAKAGKVAGRQSQSSFQAYDAAAVVQTGPGLPRWSWTTLRLGWSGPVLKGQRLHLVLVSPAMNLALALLRSALVLLVAARFFPYFGRRLPDWFGSKGAVSLAIVFFSGVATLTPRVAHAEIPDKELLEELKARVLRAPACSPTCASSSRMAIELRDNSLRLRMEVAVAAPTAIPLPGTGAQWNPTDVRVDGRSAKALVREDNLLWVALDEGTHEIVLEGATGERSQLQLSLPMKSHHVEATAIGWTVTGVHEDGLADNDLEFTRTESANGHGERTLQPGTLPPFVVVTRTIHIGLEWEVDTEVSRVTPVGSAVAIEVPLLAGERVTTADLRVAAGKAEVSFRPDATNITWHSVLPQTSPIHLVAPKNIAWTEVWRMDIGSLWHADYAGIPFVHAESTAIKVPEWHPWPGEEGVVKLTRPEGVSGQSLTIDESITTVEPGLRATDVSMTLALRSSRGGDHAITLPEGAELESSVVNGVNQPTRQEGRKVIVPVTPGAAEVRLKFRIPVGVSSVFVTPSIDLGAPSVNATVVVDVPGGRWLLFLNGPSVGPAILFWPHLLVLFVVALALGRTRSTPLRTWHWALLFIGLSQVPLIGAALFVSWLLALGYRAHDTQTSLSRQWFNLRQALLVVWTLAALVTLTMALGRGLLGTPEMQVMGNGSNGSVLRWFLDRSLPQLPTVRMVSVPLMVYRGVMLAWALWIVLSLLAWIRWGWTAFTSGAMWMQRPTVIAPTTPPTVSPPSDGA